MIIHLHTAKCKNCGVLLYFPYVDNSDLTVNDDKKTVEERKKEWNEWYHRAVFFKNRKYATNTYA